MKPGAMAAATGEITIVKPLVPPAPRIQPLQSGPMPRRIALVNQKGGVGKTTTTVSLGAALAQAGQRVLLVDLDPQAHLTLHTGIEPETLDKSVYDLLTDPAVTAESVARKINENLVVYQLR